MVCTDQHKLSNYLSIATVFYFPVKTSEFVRPNVLLLPCRLAL